jgi:hypothetical protein
MDRINTPNAVPDGNGPGKRGFRDGNKAEGIAPTEFNALHCNLSQEEICNVIEGAGIPLDHEDDTQLLEAIELIAESKASPSATETVQGKAEIATQAETDTGTDNARIVTPLKLKNGFAINLAVNGYIKFPSWLGGFILQWISSNVTITGEGDQLINLPLTFPNAGLGAVAITRIASASTSPNTFFNFRSLSTSQITLYHQGAPNSPVFDSEGYRGLVWGY